MMQRHRGGAWSLRLRLMAIVAVAALAAWGFGVAAMYWFESERNEELSDQKLADLAQVILRFSEHELLEIQAEQQAARDAGLNVHHDTLVTLDARYRYQIWSKGRMLLRSANAPADRMLAQAGQLGFGHARLDGETYCTYVATSADKAMEIQVSEAESSRDLPWPSVGPLGALALLTSAALLCAAAWLAVGASMRPMAQAQAQLAGRGPLDVEPVRVSGAPQEVAPLIGALNELFKRFGVALRREQEFTDFAAHELRTPLASLRAMAQVALRARDEAERGTALQGVVASADRCAHLVTQLLTLARVDARQLDDRHEPQDLEVAVHQVVEAVRQEPAARTRALLLRTEGRPCLVKANAFAVQMLLRNLVDNALRHTPEGGQVQVHLRALPGAARLSVDDSGPGIPEAERENVFQRFRRLQQGGPGVGLGLAIVQSVAANHGAAIALRDSALGGLRVEVDFPSLEATTGA